MELMMLYIWQWLSGTYVCVLVKGGQFDHLLWFKSPHMLMFGKKSMILL